ncbi:hypothetical protein AX16_002251 [Volvariella volvacea WC 439]|nr:hypothetical protein AX16_002251 [Volvariella volvacea WC 439]
MSAVSFRPQLPPFPPQLYTAHSCRSQSTRLIRPLPKRRLRASPVYKPVLPIELYGSIFEQISDRDDLCRLALTSRICQREAERLLYSSIALDKDPARLELWSLTILENPAKASRVRALTINFDISFLIIPDMVLQTLELLSRALHSLPNLKSLTLLGRQMVMMNPLYSWILDGCSFRLEKFHNEIFPSRALANFLTEQTDIQQWTQTDSDLVTTNHPTFSSSSSGSECLKKLKMLRGNTLLLNGLVVVRPRLERVSLRLHSTGPGEGSEDDVLIQSLSALGSSITALHIDRTISGSNCTPSTKLLSLLARHLPNLEILIFGQTSRGPWIGLTRKESQPLDSYKEVLGQYPKLKGFWLTTGSFYDVLATQTQLHSLLSHNPNLKSLAITGQISRSLSFSQTSSGVVVRSQLENPEDALERLEPWWR